MSVAVFFAFPSGLDPGGRTEPLYNRRKPETIKNLLKGSTKT